MNNVIEFPQITKYHIYYINDDIEIRVYGLYFTTIELAQEYCNKLNKKDKTVNYYTR